METAATASGTPMTAKASLKAMIRACRVTLPAFSAYGNERTHSRPCPRFGSEGELADGAVARTTLHVHNWSCTRPQANGGRGACG